MQRIECGRHRKIKLSHIRWPWWRQTVTGLSTAKPSLLILQLPLTEAGLVESAVSRVFLLAITTVMRAVAFFPWMIPRICTCLPLHTNSRLCMWASHLSYLLSYQFSSLLSQVLQPMLLYALAQQQPSQLHGVSLCGAYQNLSKPHGLSQPLLE